MLSSMRALRSGAALRQTASATASSSVRRGAINAAARGYATFTEEAPEFDPKILDRKVDMSVIEKGKGFYINYKKLDENIKIVRER